MLQVATILSVPKSVFVGRLSVRPSVRPSRSGIVSKRLSVSSYFLQHIVPPSLLFSRY